MPTLRNTSTTTRTSIFRPPTSTSTSLPLFYELTTARVAGLGTILVDGEGLTLYMFEPDQQSNESRCYGDCENRWPPVLLVAGVKKPMAGAGVNPTLIGTTMRTGGMVQITYNAWPLYLWHGDSLPGEASGQALNDSGGLWYVLDAAGHPVTTQPPP